ncbi:MAG: Mo-dependent nitrogenase C-terminal domain-containing protein [Cyanobacteria bacterium P01_G01_bin.54]
MTALFQPIKTWLDAIEIQDAAFAHWLCALIPAQCPFERDVQVLGKVLFHIPPLCKLNPFYEQVVYLRFRALCYLADDCGEDISQYC